MMLVVSAVIAITAARKVFVIVGISSLRIYPNLDHPSVPTLLAYLDSDNVGETTSALRINVFSLG